MPGPIVHLVVEKRLARQIRRLDKSHPAADLLLAEPCSPYTSFGAMGPDYLFFSIDEYSQELQDFVDFIFGVYDAFQPLIDFYEDNIAPVVESIEDAVNAVDDLLFQGLFQQIKATGEQVADLALTAAAVGITSQIDFFEFFKPPIQRGLPEDKWYWFDFLHYRRTGQYAGKMWELSQGDGDLMRYCLGYASHIGTDVVGHPFVNTIVGGPYRMHWRRHKLVENWIDAYARRFYPDSAAIKACLALGPKDKYRPDAISSSYYYRLCEFENGKLPEKLAELISKAMNEVYDPITHPSFLSPDSIDSIYRLWLKWFTIATSSHAGVPPTPVPPPGAATVTLINDFVSGFPSFPGGGGGGGGGGGFSLAAIFAAILAFVKWLIDSLTYIVDWIINHVTEILLLPIVEALAMVKWLIYQIQKGIFQIYDNLRFMLVLAGFLFPEPRDLDAMPWGAALINTGSVHLTGGISPTFSNYPRKWPVRGQPQEYHLVYPNRLRERPHSEPMPQPMHADNPEVFIHQPHPWDSAIEALYDAVENYGPPESTHEIDRQTWHTPQFGRAIPFSARLIVRGMEKIPNFNLDGDRGHGWKTWQAADPANIDTDNPVPTKYVCP